MTSQFQIEQMRSEVPGTVFVDRKTGSRYHFIELTGGCRVRFYPGGGGFEHSCPLEMFIQRFRHATANVLQPAYQATEFTCADGPERFHAGRRTKYSRGRT